MRHAHIVLFCAMCGQVPLNVCVALGQGGARHGLRNRLERTATGGNQPFITLKGFLYVRDSKSLLLFVFQ